MQVEQMRKLRVIHSALIGLYADAAMRLSEIEQLQQPILLKHMKQAVAALHQASKEMDKIRTDQRPKLFEEEDLPLMDPERRLKSAGG